LDNFFTLGVLAKMAKRENEEKTKARIKNGREDGVLKLLLVGNSKKDSHLPSRQKPQKI